MKIHLSSPDITDLEIQYVTEVLKTRNLSLGPMLGKFESAFAERVGSKYAVAVNSGTSGLHLVVRALGIGEGDVVITTPFSFISSANCMLFERARPLFVDIDEDTMNIDPKKIKEAMEGLDKPPKAILPVHVFGYPCDMDAIMEIADSNGMAVIEDSCEALGTEYKGRMVGTLGNAGVYAFYPNKQITTGEGGMIVTDDPEIAALSKSMRNQGRGETGGWFAHERLGYNYRISDVSCAIGLAQIERLGEIVAKRKRVAEFYRERLSDVAGLILPPGYDEKRMSWFVYVVRLGADYSRKDRERVLTGLRAAGIGCNNYFSPIHLQPFYKEMFGFTEGDFPVTEAVADRTIALPFYNDLGEGDLDTIAEKLRELL
ncbi:MAG: DegT/DnrJ/EryC1/StrS family aminotransferase [Thermodesulfobacteriota bacterium]